MPLATADVRPTTPDTLAGPDILGGSCPITPMQICIIWAARQEKAISPLAFKVYFAAHEVKFWRCKTEPDEPYHVQLYAFQLSDVRRLFPGVPAAKITRAFAELEALNILTLSDSGIEFADHLHDTTLNERVTHRAQAMFDQLHPGTRNKLVKIPRRLLKLLVQCGRRIVRAATLLGMLLTTLLSKRSKQYEGYKGCVKAKWIATVFGVNSSRVKSERAKWIEEGWFTREPTTPRARKKFGQWVRLNLTPPEPTPEAVENPPTDALEVQPQNPDFEPQVQPLLNQSLSSPEVIYNNQELSPQTPKPGAYQPLHLEQPTWTHIKLEDLHNETRSETLRQEAIERGHLRAIQSDQTNFFAAIAHALRVATTNPCGLLRRIVENGLWHVISQADEYNAIRRLRTYADTQETQQTRQECQSFLIPAKGERVGQVDEQVIELSGDALIVQTLTADLQREGLKSNYLPLVQRYGHLRDWHQERWDKAERELAQARLLRARQWHQGIGITRIQDMIEESANDDQPLLD